MPCERVDYYSDEEFREACEAEAQAWSEEDQRQQEPEIVPCFKCGSQMYIECTEPAGNICPECTKKEGK